MGSPINRVHGAFGLCATGSLRAVGMADFERKLERGVEGVFGRVFRTGVSPVELGRKLIREMDVNRTVSVNGATMAPNSFIITIAQDDYDQLADMESALLDELSTLVKQHAAEEQYRFAGPVDVEFSVLIDQRHGSVSISTRFKQPPEGAPLAYLVLPGGSRVPLSSDTVSIGRHTDSTIVLADQNASRNHAEVRPLDGSFSLVDLASTNGTRVNGRAIHDHLLEDGDEILFGETGMRFEKA